MNNDFCNCRRISLPHHKNNNLKQRTVQNLLIIALKMSDEHPLSRPMLPVATTPEPSSPLTSPLSSPSTSPQDNLPPPPPILPEDHQPSPRPTLVQKIDDNTVT
nr:uncharacterized protein LOC109784509 isoform X1 [Aegilops tauschii subsp. strangulata]